VSRTDRPKQSRITFMAARYDSELYEAIGLRADGSCSVKQMEIVRAGLSRNLRLQVKDKDKTVQGPAKDNGRGIKDERVNAVDVVAKNTAVVVVGRET
jgi:hypothetical protein